LTISFSIRTLLHGVIPIICVITTWDKNIDSSGSGQGLVVGFCEHVNETSSSKKKGIFFSK
jgi:hypothetical protein